VWGRDGLAEHYNAAHEPQCFTGIAHTTTHSRRCKDYSFLHYDVLRTYPAEVIGDNPIYVGGDLLQLNAFHGGIPPLLSRRIVLELPSSVAYANLYNYSVIVGYPNSKRKEIPIQPQRASHTRILPTVC
jgi:hypothetical protein